MSSKIFTETRISKAALRDIPNIVDYSIKEGLHRLIDEMPKELLYKLFSVEIINPNITNPDEWSLEECILAQNNEIKIRITVEPNFTIEQT